MQAEKMGLLTGRYADVFAALDAVHVSGALERALLEKQASIDELWRRGI